MLKVVIRKKDTLQADIVIPHKTAILKMNYY